MLISAIVKVVRACVRRAPLVVVCYAVLLISSGYYAATHFAINTDINKMLSPSLDWRQNEIDFEKSFPGRYDSILVVVDAPTPELAAMAATALTAKLKQNTTDFHAVEEVGGGAFFAREGLLFQSVEELKQTTEGVEKAVPLVRTVAGDPNLRGLAQVVTLLMQGVRGKLAQLDDLTRGLNLAAETTGKVLDGRPASFSWQVMMDARACAPARLRRLINVRPVLNYGSLEPGGHAASVIRATARALDLATAYRARVRLTGPVAMADEEFSTLRQGAFRDTAATIAVVLLILWIALRSGKLILAVGINLAVGLATTAAIGLWVVGALNPISVAFAVLFIGLGVDFGIQFAVRYRTERHANDNLRSALLATARKIGAPLTLAAAAVAAAFLSFTPTDYTGPLMDLCQRRRGDMKKMEYMSPERVELVYEIPLAEVVVDFFDQMKSRTKGYASLDYELAGYRPSNLVKVDLLLNGQPADAFSTIVHRDHAYEYGRRMCEKLKELIPRQMFDVPIQAAIGGKVISRETVKAKRKDVLAKCYGGDITRKRKLLEKQKEGKKKMKSIGRVEVPGDVFINALKLDD